MEDLQNRLGEEINSPNITIRQRKQQAKNFILTTVTQGGKTKSIIDCCVNEIETKKFIVISCDNLKDQLEQMKKRLENENITVYTINSLTHEKLENNLNTGKSVVVVILSNDSQIKKLHNFITHIPLYKRPSKFLFFHDEGDMMNKADDLEDLNDKDISKAHRRWVNLMNCLENSNLPVCRFWVSATPENCSHISRITGKDIFVIPLSERYRGISQHKIWDPTQTDPIRFEIERIRSLKSREVILYNVDRENLKHDTKAKEFSSLFNCITVTYNMKQALLYKNGSPYSGVRISKKDSISEILEKLTDKGPIIVLGCNLLTRAMSLVGLRRHRPMTATVMFCSSGKSSHVVGTSQKFGRICGTSRPDISRRVIYCSDRMYSDYTSYLKNQELVFSKLANPYYRDMTMAEILDDCEDSHSLKNNLDRPLLKNVNSEYSYSTDSGIGSERVLDTNPDKMKRLINTWRRPNATSCVSKIFKEILINGGALDSTRVIEIVANNTADGSYYTNLTAPLSNNNTWGLVFRKDGDSHYIRNEAMEYLNTL